MAYYTLIGSGGGGGGASNWVDLGDTPGSHVAEAIPYTNAGGTALTTSTNLTYDGTQLKAGNAYLAYGSTAAFYTDSYTNGYTYDIYLASSGAKMQFAGATYGMELYADEAKSLGLGTNTSGVYMGYTASTPTFVIATRYAAASGCVAITHDHGTASAPDVRILRVGHTNSSNAFTDGFYYNPDGTTGDDRGLNIVDDGIGATGSTGLILRNDTDATGSNEEYPPLFRFSGSVWDDVSAAENVTAEIAPQPFYSSGAFSNLKVRVQYGGAIEDAFTFGTTSSGQDANYSAKLLMTAQTGDALWIGANRNTSPRFYYNQNQSIGIGSTSGMVAGLASNTSPVSFHHPGTNTLAQGAFAISVGRSSATAPDFPILRVGWSYSNTWFNGFYYNPDGTTADDRGLNIVDDSLEAATASALILKNTTDATAAIPEIWSPSLEWRGSAQDTDAGGDSPVGQRARMYLAARDAAAPYPQLQMEYSDDDGSSWGVAGILNYANLGGIHSVGPVSIDAAATLRLGGYGGPYTGYYYSNINNGFGISSGFYHTSGVSVTMGFTNQRTTAATYGAFGFTWDHGQASTTAGKIVTFGETLSSNSFSEAAFIGTGESYIPQPAGSMTMHGNSTATDFTALGGTWVKAAGTFSAGNVNDNFSVASNLLTYDGAQTRNIKYSATVSAETSTSATCLFAFAVNGTIDTDSVCHRYISSTGSSGEGAIPLEMISSIANGDDVDIYVQHPTNGATITLTEVNIVASSC